MKNTSSLFSGDWTLPCLLEQLVFVGLKMLIAHSESWPIYIFGPGWLSLAFLSFKPSPNIKWPYWPDMRWAQAGLPWAPPMGIPFWAYMWSPTPPTRPIELPQSTLDWNRWQITSKTRIHDQQKSEKCKTKTGKDTNLQWKSIRFKANNTTRKVKSTRPEMKDVIEKSEKEQRSTGGPPLSHWIAACSSLRVWFGEICFSFWENDDWSILLEMEKERAKMVERVLMELERRGCRGSWDFWGMEEIGNEGFRV